MDIVDVDFFFEEGDIVGVFEGSDGESCIEKLIYFNVLKVIMVGVISRLVYFEVKIFVEDENKGIDWSGSVWCLLGFFFCVFLWFIFLKIVSIIMLFLNNYFENYLKIVRGDFYVDL